MGSSRRVWVNLYNVSNRRLTLQQYDLAFCICSKSKMLTFIIAFSRLSKSGKSLRDYYGSQKRKRDHIQSESLPYTLEAVLPSFFRQCDTSLSFVVMYNNNNEQRTYKKLKKKKKRNFSKLEHNIKIVLEPFKDDCCLTAGMFCLSLRGCCCCLPVLLTCERPWCCPVRRNGMSVLDEVWFMLTSHYLIIHLR